MWSLDRLSHDLAAFRPEAERYLASLYRHIGFQQGRRAPRSIVAGIALSAGANAAGPRELQHGCECEFQGRGSPRELTGNAAADARQGMRKIGKPCPSLLSAHGPPLVVIATLPPAGDASDAPRSSQQVLTT
jgi:hypothetical protein